LQTKPKKYIIGQSDKHIVTNCSQFIKIFLR
jgi:hypothetical protein